MLSNYDTQQDEARFYALENEIKQNEASIEADFAKYGAQALQDNEQMDNLYFEDKEAFLLAILKMQNEFLENGLMVKKREFDTLGNEIKRKKGLKSIEEASQAFLSKHPDANLDAMLDFYQNDTSARTKQGLEQLAPEDFFESLYELYQAQNTQENPPKRMEGDPNANPDGYDPEAYGSSSNARISQRY